MDNFKEPRLTAAFLYHLAQLVTWPEDKFNRRDEPVLVGCMGENSNEIVRFFITDGASLKSGERSILAVRRSFSDSDSAKKLSALHILFIQKSLEERMKEILPPLGRAGVLTVSDMESFAELGGMVSFFIKDQKINIHVNLRAVQNSGIKISAQFLQHVKIINPPGATH